MSIKDKIKSAKLSETDVSICNNMDAAFALGRAYTALNEANALAESDKRLTGSGKTEAQLEAERALAEADERARLSTIDFHITALPFEKFNSLKLEHPPRDGNELDRAAGYNRDSFYIAAAELTARAKEDDGVLVDLTAAEWSEFREGLASGEWDQMVQAIDLVNNNSIGSGAAFFLAASKTIRESDMTSESPTPSE